MKKFVVGVPELHYSYWEVEALNEEEAKDLVISGEGEFLEYGPDYSHRLEDRSKYTIEDKCSIA